MTDDAPVNAQDGTPQGSSPLEHLFAEERKGDQQAREALFLTFNVDLGYFERAVLGVTNACGARATVISDARNTSHDVRAVRGAGSRYVSAVAATINGAAFHPKLTVLVGPQRALIAIGSGNMSMGGWQYNSEIWTIVEATRDECPEVISQISDWLKILPNTAAISPAGRAALDRTAALLDHLANGGTTASRHRLVHTGSQSLLSQLPDHRAKSLRLHAPFHDPNCAALKALIERYQPESVDLLLQPGRTVVNQDALRDAVAWAAERDCSIRLLADSDTAYRHGKLIEAEGADGVAGGENWALTGSPNLSAAALLLAAPGRANCEIGIVTTGAGLFPEGVDLPLDDVPTVSIESTTDQDREAYPLLLAAEVIPHGLQLDLDGPPLAGTRVLLSSLAGKPDQWLDIAGLSGTTTQHTINHQISAGSHIRLTWPTGGDTTQVTQMALGGIVFVTNRALALRPPRQGNTRGRTDNTPVDLFGNATLAMTWLQNVEQLATTQKQTALPTTLPAGLPSNSDSPTGTFGGARTDDQQQTWLSYTDDAADRLGDQILSLALGGLPALGARSTRVEHPDIDGSWDDTPISEAQAGLAGDDEPGTQVDEPPAEMPTTDASAEDDPDLLVQAMSQATALQKRRARRWLTDATRIARHLPVIDRLAFTTLVLTAIASDFYESPDGQDGWGQVLLEAIDTLCAVDPPDAINANVASAAAVGLYLVEQHVDRASMHALAAHHDQVTQSATPRLTNPSVERTGDYSTHLRNRYGFPIDPGDVMAHTANLANRTSFTPAINRIERKYPDASTHLDTPHLLHVHGKFSNPGPVAAEALEATSAPGPVGAWVTTERDTWTLLVRDQMTLLKIAVDRPGSTATWRLYELKATTGPLAVMTDSDVEKSHRTSNPPWNRPPAGARQILERISVTISDDGSIEPPDLMFSCS